MLCFLYTNIVFSYFVRIIYQILKRKAWQFDSYYVTDDDLISSKPVLNNVIFILKIVERFLFQGVNFESFIFIFAAKVRFNG